MVYARRPPTDIRNGGSEPPFRIAVSGRVSGARSATGNNIDLFRIYKFGSSKAGMRLGRGGRSGAGSLAAVWARSAPIAERWRAVPIYFSSAWVGRNSCRILRPIRHDV